MINFRFHLVSLIAVFLALGLGILVGSSVVDQVIVDRLHREITSVRNESNSRRTENSRLKGDVSQLQNAIDASTPYTVQDRLQGVPVALIAEHGVDSAAVKQILTVLQEAGADVPGVLWLDDSWRLDATKDVQALGTAAKVVGSASETRNGALALLAARLAEPDPSRKAKDPLDALRSSGFISLTQGSDKDLAAFPAGAARALVVTGTDSHLAGSDTLLQLTRALTDAKVPTVVSEVYDESGGPNGTAGRGDAVAPVRGDTPLAKVVTTVDDVDLAQGRVGAVLGLEQLTSGTVGHYGYGRGASAALPRVPA